MSRFAAFSLDTEQPDYDLDSEDDTFVNKLNKKMQITALQFEEMIDRLEKGSGQQVFCQSALTHREERHTLACFCLVLLAVFPSQSLNINLNITDDANKRQS